MKRICVLACVSIAVLLNGCAKKDTSLSEKDIKATAKTETSSINDSSSQIDAPSTEAINKAQKVFPSHFTEAINIEAKRQDMLKTDIRVEMDKATDNAFNDMKVLYKSYCGKVKGLLNDDQKKAFDNMLAAEKQYNISLDIFTFKTLSQQVYTTGNASCSESYNLITSDVSNIYYYYNHINNQSVKNDNSGTFYDNQIKEHLFFSNNLSSIDGKTSVELNALYNNTVPLLNKVLNSTSQPVFDEYKKAYANYLSAVKAFEKSIGITVDNSNVYSFIVKLNTCIVNNLYVELKDKKYTDGIFEKLNGSINKEEFLQKWN